ncbi:MAG: hypothetical protein WBC83_00390 [Minisyncoccia bacterium]
MDNETTQIFREQLGKLPSTVVDFISSTNWDADLNEIGSMYNLHKEELGKFKQEATLVLAGLIHPDEFRSALEQETDIQGAVLDAIVNATEEKIFAPVRQALVVFFEQESAENVADIPEQEGIIETIPPPATVPALTPMPTRVWEKEPDIAPDNLPTSEEPESFLPPIPPKNPRVETEVPSWDITPTHPFEEKMKKVFTAGQQSMGDLTIEPATPQVAQPDTSRTYHADPYREPIE